ncbi:MAG: cyclic nucleotide-binding domain-containing protein [Proteobacteria bacterium]|nr:cyclic nucleotide-binding domain-containing protein [Pseudomonadota bacterium]
MVNSYAGLKFFRGFKLEEISFITKLMIPVVYAGGEAVLKEGEVSKVLMLITSGQAKVVKTIDEKNVKILALLGEGDIIGEMSFFDDAPHNASVIAHNNLNVLALSKKDFESIIEKNERLAIKILVRIIQICSQRIRNLNEEVKELGHWCVSLRDTRK